MCHHHTHPPLACKSRFLGSCMVRRALRHSPSTELRAQLRAALTMARRPSLLSPRACAGESAAGSRGSRVPNGWGMVRHAHHDAAAGCCNHPELALARVCAGESAAGSRGSRYSRPMNGAHGMVGNKPCPTCGQRALVWEPDSSGVVFVARRLISGGMVRGAHHDGSTLAVPV